MKKGTSESLLERQRAEIEALAALPDDEIDTSDLPEIRDWSGARRGLLYRPVKQQITLRLDADVVAWFKANARAAGDTRRRSTACFASTLGVRRPARSRRAALSITLQRSSRTPER